MPDVNPPGDVQQPEENGWQKTNLTFDEVGKRLETAVSQMKGTECRARVLAETPRGKGVVFLATLIDSPSLYHVEYLSNEAQPSRVVVLGAHGSKRTVSNKGMSKEIPINQPLGKSDALSDPNEFVRDFTRSLVSSTLDGKNAWGGLIKKLRSGEGGFQAVVEERTVTYDERKHTNYRIFAKRSSEAASKLGEAEFEIVLDPKRWVPVTIRTSMTDLGKNHYQYEWTAGWKFGQKFDPKHITFAAPPIKQG